MTNEVLALNGSATTVVSLGSSLSYTVQNKYSHTLSYRESGTSGDANGYLTKGESLEFDADYEFWYPSALDSDTFLNFVNRDTTMEIVMSHCEAIARDRLVGARTGQAVGEMEGITVTASGYDLSELGVATVPTPDIENGETMAFKSTSTDDNPTGIGAREVTIKYIDPVDKTLKGLVLPTDGTTETIIPVNISFVSDFYVSKNDIVDNEPTAAVGDIAIYRQGTPAREYCIVKAGGNKSFTLSRLVPSDKDFYINQYIVSGNTKGVSVRLRATIGDDGTLTDGWLFKLPLTIGDTAIPMALNPPIKISAGARLKVTTYGSTTNVDISAFINGTLEPKLE